MKQWSTLPLALSVFTVAAHGENATSNADSPAPRLVVVAEGLEQPRGLATLPGGLFVISERTGQLQTLYNGQRQRVEGLPGIHVEEQGGLLDIAASPDYPDTGWLYFTYSSDDEDSTAVALARGQLAG